MAQLIGMKYIFPLSGFRWCSFTIDACCIIFLRPIRYSAWSIRVANRPIDSYWERNISPVWWCV